MSWRNRMELLEPRRLLSSGAGSVDPSFGHLGKVIPKFGASVGLADLAVQADGKIIVVGGSGADATSDFFVARLNVDGTIDKTFGVGGSVRTDFRGGDDDAFHVALQSDGDIVVIGHAGANLAIARYLRSG